MNAKKCAVAAALLFALAGMCLYAEPDAAGQEPDAPLLNERTGFPEIVQKPYLVFDYGAAIAWVTRIQKQTGRSNFVMANTMLGLYFTAETRNMKPIDSLLRVSAFYPIQNTFNKVPQVAKQVILYAVDAFYAPVFEADMWKYVRIEFAPGIHFLYQLTDNWRYMALGGGVLLGAELPVAKHWTILANGTATFDYANLGSNASMFPISYQWQYQLTLGVRYSKKAYNAYSYITSREEARERRAQSAAADTQDAEAPTAQDAGDASDDTPDGTPTD